MLQRQSFSHGIDIWDFSNHHVRCWLARFGFLLYVPQPFSIGQTCRSNKVRFVSWWLQRQKILLGNVPCWTKRLVAHLTEVCCSVLPFDLFV